MKKTKKPTLDKIIRKGLKTNNPVKHLTVLLKKHSGRNNQGKITVRHRGGRHKRFLRIIDDRRGVEDVKGVVVGIEDDPNRTANLAKIEYEQNEYRYILCPQGLKIGDKIQASIKASIKIGNALPLVNIPLGTEIHSIELYPNGRAQMVKSAGTSAIIIAKDEKYADVKLPSKEVRKISLNAFATIGRVSNVEHKLEEIGSAGRNRHKGWRPTVRGTAQNPRTHPHGGGEGRSGEGMHAKTPWGKPARGNKTRKHVWSNALIVKKRNQK